MRTLVLLAMMIVLAGLAVAHPASEIIAEFDLETHTLTIELPHSVKSADKHFIDEIEIKLNGDVIITQKFMSQTNEEMQKASYVIVDAKVSDEIEIKANCNKFGKKKETIEIEKPKPDNSEE